jgi:hypothetical protein
MHTVWDRLKDRVRIEVRPEEALVTHTYEFPIPSSILWEYVTKPEYRIILMGASKLEIRDQAQGRTGVDSTYYCYHGDRETQQLILDWRPFEQFTTEDSNSWEVASRVTYKFEPTETGTRLIDYWGNPRGSWLKVRLFSLAAKFVFSPQVVKWAEELAQRIQQDLADGTVSVAPPLDIDKDQIASLATQALTAEQ